MTAGAGGSSVSGSWWSVTIRSTPSSRARRLGAADAAVHRDHEGDAVGVQPLDRRRLQPVAVFQPLGDEVDHVAAEEPERASKNHGRRDAVDVVVPVDRDPFLAGERRHDALDGDAHVGEQHRIVQVFEGRVEEALRTLGVGEAALTEQPRHRRVDLESRGERRGGRVVAGRQIPSWTNRGHQRGTSCMFTFVTTVDTVETEEKSRCFTKTSPNGSLTAP